VLPAPETEPAPEAEAQPADRPLQQIQSLRDEVNQLRKYYQLINERVGALERLQGMAAPVLKPPPRPVPTSQLEPVPTPGEAAITAPETITVPSAEISKPVKPPPPPPREHPPTKPREWEQILGGNWLARIGVIALIIGVAFFLKFAFDQNWLGPTARVILGVVAGAIMVGAGYYWRKRYPTFAQALSGGGIALFYLSFFAAFAIFSLIPLYGAVGLLLLVSIGSAALATRYNSMALAIIGILGAFAAPFIIGITAPGGVGTSPGDQGIQLLVYIAIVDAGVLVLSTFRNWRWFTLIALFSSLLAFAGWHGEFGDRASLLTSQLSITLIFLIFVGATSLFHIIWRKAARGFDYALMFINAAAYFGISYGLMWHDLRAWMGGFTIALALFYAGLAYTAFRRGGEDTRISLFALAIAIVLLTVAIPVQLGDKAWTTIAWAAEGAVLMWLALTLKMPHFRNFCYAVFTIAVIRLIFFDTTVSMRGFNPVFNERFLAFIVSIAAMYLTAYLVWRNREEGRRAEYPTFLIAANFFTLWIIGAEVFSYSKIPPTLSADLSLIILLVLAGATTLYHLVWRRKPQIFDLVLTVVNAAAYSGISAWLWQDLRAWMGFLYFVLALFYGILTYVTLKRNTESARLGSFALGITIVFFTVALAVQLGDTKWTTIAWAAEFVALMWLSFALRTPQLRNYGYGIFVIMAGRLLLFDTSVDVRAFQPVLNQRFLAFVVGIAASYFAAYLLWRQRKNMPEWNIPASTFLVAANLFSLWLLSFEVWNYIGSQLAALTPAGAASNSLRNAQNLSLTALWAVYAVILLVIGIAKRWRAVRLAALGLLVVPIIKVFVYDVFALEQVYRIVAFVGLGLLLLSSAYLYQRYSRAIRGFLTNK
jgi:uncharacterized membrane protein